MKNIKIFAIISALLIMVACGGGDDGLDRSKALSAMSPDDSKALCEALDGKVSLDDAVKVSCYFAAIFASAFDEEIECEPYAQECIAEGGEDIEPVACSELDQQQIDALPACAADVTIGEYEDCIDATLSAFTELAANISCEIDEEQEEPELPAACQVVANKCPELLN